MITAPPELAGGAGMSGMTVPVSLRGCRHHRREVLWFRKDKGFFIRPRSRPGITRRLWPLLARRAEPRRAPQAPHQPLRPGLARQRDDRRRQTAPCIRRLLQRDRPSKVRIPKRRPETRGDKGGSDGGRSRSWHCNSNAGFSRRSACGLLRDS